MARGGDQDMFQMPGKYHIENETCPPYRTIDMIAAIFAIISTIGADANSYLRVYPTFLLGM